MALLQKTYVADPLTHKQIKNNGEVSQYFVENSHEAIISVEVFEAVQYRKQTGELMPGMMGLNFVL